MIALVYYHQAYRQKHKTDGIGKQLFGLPMLCRKPAAVRYEIGLDKACNEIKIGGSHG